MRGFRKQFADMSGWFATGGRFTLDILLILAPAVVTYEKLRHHNTSFLLMLLYSVPLCLAGALRLTRSLRSPRVDFNIKAPSQDTKGTCEALNLILKELFVKFPDAMAVRLRLTAFVPDTSNMRLVQVGRYSWTGDEHVSSTTIRMGTCSVGHAYNREQIWHVDDVNSEEHISLEHHLRFSGLTKSEISQQKLRARSTFCAVPIFTLDEDGTSNDVVLAVIAIDSSRSSSIPGDFPDIVFREYTTRIQQALLGKNAPKDYVIPDVPGQRPSQLPPGPGPSSPGDATMSNDKNAPKFGVIHAQNLQIVENLHHGDANQNNHVPAGTQLLARALTEVHARVTAGTVPEPALLARLETALQEQKQNGANVKEMVDDLWLKNANNEMKSRFKLFVDGLPEKAAWEVLKEALKTLIF